MKYFEVDTDENSNIMLTTSLSICIRKPTVTSISENFFTKANATEYARESRQREKVATGEWHQH
jgi:hypothetical protein